MNQFSTCRYCGQPSADDLERPICRKCHDLHELHRTEEGVASCETCGRQEDARYRCTGCDATFIVPGVFQWMWQGHSHFHVADHETTQAFTQASLDHFHLHGKKTMVVPEHL